jgi:cytochrome c553
MKIPVKFLCPVFLILYGAGCASLQERAPEISVAIANTGAKHGAGIEQLAAGRKILVTRCTECHAPRIVRNYPADEWPMLVDKMAPRAKLSASQKNDLLAYLLAVRKTE